MKKTLFPLAILALSLGACNTTPKYTINGTLEGAETGNVFLVKYAGQNLDTLAKAAVTHGKFTMTGTVDGLTDAFLTIEGKRGGTPVFIENAVLTANLDMNKPMENKVTGTPAQELANQFMAISQGAQKAQSDLYQQYMAASQEKDEAKMKEIEEKYNKVEADAKAEEEALMKANSDSYVAAYILSSKMGGMDVEELEEQFKILGPNAQASVPGKKIADRIQKMAAVAVGQVAPDFTLETPDGKQLSMHSIKGKVKLIDFWASWCGPCRGENPNVVKVYNEYHPKGLEILSVSLDNNKEKWVEAIEKDGLTWNHVSDLKGWQSAAAQLYGVNGIPHLIVLDENNVIIAKNLRGEKLREKIAELLK